MIKKWVIGIKQRLVFHKSIQLFLKIAHQIILLAKKLNNGAAQEQKTPSHKYGDKDE